MKALIHLDQNGKKVMERRVHDAVMKERADISTRAQYVWALSMLQCGLPPCTVQRVSDHFEAVLDKYMEYQTEDLGDLFMRSICACARVSHNDQNQGTSYSVRCAYARARECHRTAKSPSAGFVVCGWAFFIWGAFQFFPLPRP